MNDLTGDKKARDSILSPPQGPDVPWQLTKDLTIEENHIEMKIKKGTWPRELDAVHSRSLNSFCQSSISSEVRSYAADPVSVVQ